MQPENITVDNPFINREDLEKWVDEIFSAVTPFFKNDTSRVDLGNFTTHYGHHIANMETFSRFLLGVIPLLAGGNESGKFHFYIQAIKNGTNPDHADYWGEWVLYDQRPVEMAAFGQLLALAHKPLLAHFSPQEQHNLWQWLKQSEMAVIPDNNWHFFPILEQVAFQISGMTVNRETIENHFTAMEHYYLGDGWYSDGPDRPRDYYISMGFHFYGLLYAQLMTDFDPNRCAELRKRAALFAQDFIHFFAEDGPALPFGRSLTYRFAEVAFWSVVAFANLDVYSPGVIVHQRNHLRLLTSGQLELNNFVNTEAKYCKFAYSTRYAFTVERGRLGLSHARPDSMLWLSEKDNYWRGRRDCQQVTVTENQIYSRWKPWNDAVIMTRPVRHR